MKVGVIGAGMMGAGIAQVSAAAGHQVVLSDVDLARAEAGKAGIAKLLARQVAKGALEQGAACYDFLAGDARYKTDLGGEPYAMGHWSVHRHGPAVWVQEALQRARAGLARVAPLAGTALSLRKRPVSP